MKSKYKIIKKNLLKFFKKIIIIINNNNNSEDVVMFIIVWCEFIVGVICDQVGSVIIKKFLLFEQIPDCHHLFFFN